MLLILLIIVPNTKTYLQQGIPVGGMLNG